MYQGVLKAKLYVVPGKGVQNVTGADQTDQRRRHHPDSTADRVSRGRHSEGKASSDAATGDSEDNLEGESSIQTTSSARFLANLASE
ncbi:hypothetical protein SO802_000003 [Lithocarpus litseifolius]|uniref:Uncharacterized protein n=1 Tax=Lithocarpus litseifolius TaxID=425828 RepID=A0AAW2DS28_9ROSI